jgi:hypothetical protein
MLGWLLHAPRGPLYSPKVARSRWRPTRKAKIAFCRVAHRTVTVAVRCTISFLFWRIRPLVLGIGWCTGQSGAPRRPLMRATHRAKIALSTVGADDRWLTGQSSAPSDSLVNYSRTLPNFSRERPVHRSSAWRIGHCPCTTGQSGVPDRAGLRLYQAKSFAFPFFSSFLCF